MSKAIKSAQAGTPVPEKDTSTKAKEAKADGTNKSSAMKGSLTVAIGLPHVTDKGDGYENSYRDYIEDSRAARRKGISTEDYEGSAHDRIADKAGAKRMRDEEQAKVNNPPGYKAGVAASQNSPKVSHGYGHSAANRDGHLRCSGSPGAHRIGKRK